MLKRAEFVVKGLVQGVGFRYYVYRHARILGLKGYTQNTYDGNVYVVAEGEESDLIDLQKQLWVGPSEAYVEDIYAKFIDYTGDFHDFGIR
jgi:acylphosphatase